jgi:dTDP-glucose 4,6-dehydratase
VIPQKLLVTGGAGFIGSAFVRLALERWPAADLVVLDALTYAGNLKNLDEIQSDRPTFVHGDISDSAVVVELMAGCDAVVNIAAETHVDRSILDASQFIRTNVDGTRVLLDAARDAQVRRFVQVSTDEVYGDVEAPHRSRESDPLQPRSPYAASKAAGDLLVGAYRATYGLPTIITRGSNTYGPRQFPEKLIPLFVTNALEGRSLPVYGDGLQVRDWMHVDDHCAGIATALELGEEGGVYNIGAGQERTNLDVVRQIVEVTDASDDLIRYVPDRPGHDRRYALDTDSIRNLGWRPVHSAEEGLTDTIRWFVEHPDWWQAAKSADFDRYYAEQYGNRLSSP